MTEPRTAAEVIRIWWNDACQDWLADPHKRAAVLRDLKRAVQEYARQVRAQEREACAAITDGVPDPSAPDTGQMWRKTAALAIGRAIRARPDVEVP